MLFVKSRQGWNYLLFTILMTSFNKYLKVNIYDNMLKIYVNSLYCDPFNYYLCRNILILILIKKNAITISGVEVVVT